MLKSTGIATDDLINGVYPDKERRSRGAFAMVECFQQIPCNPCVSSCKRGAIIPLKNINDLPKVDFEKCNGCGVCVAQCPGLAIFVIDESYSETEALIKMPYEFLPLPLKGDKVFGTDREGKAVCRAEVKNVVTAGGTSVVWLSVPKQLSTSVRSFVFCKEDCSQTECLPIDKIDDSTQGDIYVCRCEEITVNDLRRYIAEGYTTLAEIKIVSRAGMGPCQGRTCRQLIINELARQTGEKPEDMIPATFRPPVKPIKMSLLCGDDKDNV